VHDEYLPAWISQKPTARAAASYALISGEGKVIPNYVTTQTIDLLIEARTNVILQINKIYYPGWGITIDNQLVPIDYQDPTGVMKVTIPNGMHRITATFRETIPRFLSDMISVLSIIIFFIMIRQKKNRV
jgi:uncharacterized membrane protein YfhO